MVQLLQSEKSRSSVVQFMGEEGEEDEDDDDEGCSVITLGMATLENEEQHK